MVEMPVNANDVIDRETENAKSSIDTNVGETLTNNSRANLIRRFNELAWSTWRRRAFTLLLSGAGIVIESPLAGSHEKKVLWELQRRMTLLTALRLLGALSLAI